MKRGVHGETGDAVLEPIETQRGRHLEPEFRGIAYTPPADEGALEHIERVIEYP